MKHSILLEKMMKRPLLLAVIATFVAGCTTTPRIPVELFRSAEAVSGVGAAGPAGATGEQGHLRIERARR